MRIITKLLYNVLQTLRYSENIFYSNCQLEVASFCNSTRLWNMEAMLCSQRTLTYNI
jgi:hypothetical protein